MGPWAHGSMRPWAMGPWVHGPMGPWAMAPWAMGPWAMAPWTHGPWDVGHGTGTQPMGHGTGAMGRWAYGHTTMAPWDRGTMGPWALLGFKRNGEIAIVTSSIEALSSFVATSPYCGADPPLPI